MHFVELLLIIIFGYCIIRFFNFCIDRWARYKALQHLQIGDKIYTCEFDEGGTFKTGSIIRESIQAYEITNFEIQGFLFKRLIRIFTSGGQFFAKDYMQNNYTFWRSCDIDLFLDELEANTLLEDGELENLQILKDGISLVRKDARSRNDEELEQRCDDLILNINLKLKKP